jgi:hypothetical protein
MIVEVDSGIDVGSGIKTFKNLTEKKNATMVSF